MAGKPRARAASRDRTAIDSGLAQGMEHHRAGDLDSAEQCYRAVKRRDPNYAEAMRLRGLIAYQYGDFDGASKLLRQAIKSRPTGPVYHHTLAEVLRSSGAHDAAVAPYRRAYALDPDRPQNGLDLAATLADTGCCDDALAIYRELIERWPALSAAHAQIATLLYERGAPCAAHEYVAGWQAHAETEAPQQHAIAAAWVSLGDHARAESVYRRILATQPHDARACGRLGETLQSQGRFEEAAEWLEYALNLDPTQGWIYAALMSNRGYAMPPARESAMATLAADDDLDAEARAHVYFARGHLHDQRGEPADAFANFKVGNDLRRASAPFDRSRFDERIERIRHFFSADFFRARSTTSGVLSEKPLFVVGMPRSGTSLVEQIVASHPQAVGAGEIEDLRRLVREIPALMGSSGSFPDCLGQANDQQLRDWATRYQGALEGRAPDAARVVDKMPFNLLWLGLVALLFPNARVVYCRREAMDNCLSCYFQMFGRGLRFTYDLEHLGHVYRQHERLMAHWFECLPLAMLTVDYESLVAEPGPQIRRLIDFIGLEWDERCLAAHRTERSVRTASVWQVRQPVYTSSIARWRRYEPWLGDLMASLEASM